VKDSGGGENIKISIELTKEGSLNMNLSKDFSISLKGKYTLAAEKDIDISSKQNITSAASQKNTVKGNQVEINSNTTATLSARTVDIKGNMVNISNSATFPAVRGTPDLIALLQACSAVVKVPLSPTYLNYKVKC
jgi:molybdenum cofactor biosynthesis enzyme